MTRFAEDDDTPMAIGRWRAREHAVLRGKPGKTALRELEAALLALPLGFGLALTSTSVHTYINRRVPISHQGRTFALQSSLKNGTAIIPLLSLSAAAGVFGVEAVLLASPLLLFALAYALIQLSRHFGGHAPRGSLGVMTTYWEEPA